MKKNSSIKISFKKNWFNSQVPLGLTAAGLPVGVQVVAAPRGDALALAAARHLEDHFGGFQPPCKVLH